MKKPRKDYQKTINSRKPQKNSFCPESTNSQLLFFRQIISPDGPLHSKSTWNSHSLYNAPRIRGLCSLNKHWPQDPDFLLNPRCRSDRPLASCCWSACWWGRSSRHCQNCFHWEPRWIRWLHCLRPLPSFSIAGMNPIHLNWPKSQCD